MRDAHNRVSRNYISSGFYIFLDAPPMIFHTFHFYKLDSALFVVVVQSPFCFLRGSVAIRFADFPRAQLVLCEYCWRHAVLQGQDDLCRFAIARSCSRRYVHYYDSDCSVICHRRRHKRFFFRFLVASIV